MKYGSLNCVAYCTNINSVCKSLCFSLIIQSQNLKKKMQLTPSLHSSSRHSVSKNNRVGKEFSTVKFVGNIPLNTSLHKPTFQIHGT